MRYIALPIFYTYFDRILRKGYIRMSLLIKNASQIVQVVSDKKCFLTGDDSKTLAIVEQDNSGEKLSLVVCR